MLKVSAPDGHFELRPLINPGLCPQCGEMAKKIWYYVPEKDDRFNVGTGVVMSCENCAGGIIDV